MIQQCKSRREGGSGEQPRNPGFTKRNNLHGEDFHFFFSSTVKSPMSDRGLEDERDQKRGNVVTPLVEKCSELTISSMAWNEEIGWPNDLNPFNLPPCPLPTPFTPPDSATRATRLGNKRWRSLDFNHNTTTAEVKKCERDHLLCGLPCPSLSHSNLHSSESTVNNTDSQQWRQIDSLSESTHHSHLGTKYICLLLINSSPMIHTREYYESINHTIYSAT